MRRTTTNLDSSLEQILDHRGRTPKKLGGDFVAEGIPVISAKNVSDERGIDLSSTSVRHITPEMYNTWMPEKLQEGDVILTSEAPLGKVALVGPGVFCLGQRVFGLRPDKGILNSSFLCHFLRSPECKRQFGSRATGTTVKGIRQSELRQIEIVLPPLEEQRRIATILDKADALRRKRQESLALMDEFLRSVFLEMFGDPVVNPMGWKTNKIANVTEKVTDGTHKTPSYQDSGVVFISAKNIRNGGLDWSNTRHISQTEHNQLYKRCDPKRGDILLAKSGRIGTAAIVDVDFPFSCFESAALIRPNSTYLNSVFMTSLLNSNAMRRLYERFKKGVAVKHLHLRDIRDLTIITPPLADQENYAAIYESKMRQRRALDESLEHLEHLFASLTQRAFRGDLTGGSR